MRINNIVAKESALLESMMAGTDRETCQYLRNMQENFVVPYTKYLNSFSRRLTEAELTPDQITQLFGAVTQGAQQAGGNETMLGKMMPDSIKKKFSDSLPAPDAGEVPGFQEKATAAVAQISDPATKQSLMQMIKQGLQNPVTQKLIISGVQGIAGIAAGALTGGLGGKLGATAAGAITGGLVGLVAAKLQGQDWKSAAKAGLKGAAVGGAGGLVGSVATGLAGSAMDAMKGQTPAAEQPVASGQRRGAPSGDMAPGDYDTMGVATNADGSPMTVDQTNAAKAQLRAGNATDMSTPAEEPAGITARPAGLQPTTNLDGSERPGAAAANAAASSPAAPIGGNFDSGIAPTGPNGQPMRAVPMDEPTVGSSFDSGIAPTGPNGQPMRAVPMDEPTVGGNFDSGIAPTGPNGQPMRAVPMDEPADTTAADSGQEISADGKPYPEGLTAQQKQIYDNPIQVGSNNTGTVSFTDGAKMDAVFVPPGGISPRFPAGSQKMDFPFDGKMITGYVVGNKVWFPNFSAPQTESKKIKARALTEIVDRNLTVHMWALNESLGKPRGGVHLTEAGVGGIMSGISSWLKTKGQNLTQTVTADKLMQAWNKAGKPTDSSKIADLLQKQGVPSEIISSSYQSMGIPAAGPVEPTMDPIPPEAPAGSPAAPSPAPAAPSPTSTTTAAPAPAAPATTPAAPATGSSGTSIFADPKKLTYEFESYMEAGGKIPPQMRGVLKDILLTALRTVESKQRKLNAIIKESKRLQHQVTALKKRKQI